MNLLIKEEDIQHRVKELGQKIAHDYRDTTPVLIGVLKGACIFLADLLREITIPVELDFLTVSSYDGNRSSGMVRLVSDVSLPITQRDVILVEDIIDTGRTVSYLVETLKARNPKSLVVCALLEKQKSREFNVPLTYVGFKIPSIFVVGYGLDYKSEYRNLKYIGVLNGS